MTTPTPVQLAWGAPHLCGQLPMLSREQCIAYELERNTIFNQLLANEINDDQAARELKRLAKRIDAAAMAAAKEVA